jgi:DNA excision repair protein ERCC-2
MRFCPKCETKLSTRRNNLLVCLRCGYTTQTMIPAIQKAASTLDYQKRPWQEKVIQRSASAISAGRRVVLDAPTGSGKTLIALGVARRLISDKKFDKAYVAVRTINEMVPYERDLERFFPDLTHRYVLGKRRACPFYTLGDDGNSSLCSACLKGERMVVNASQVEREMLKGLYYLERKYVKRVVESRLEREHNGVCLYHSMRGMQASISLLTYPYITNPALAGAMLFDDKSIGEILPESLLIVDEAHNVEDASELFTDKITPRIFENAARSFSEDFKHLFKVESEFISIQKSLDKFAKMVSTFYDPDGRTIHKEKKEFKELLDNDLREVVAKIQDASSKIEVEKREFARKGSTTRMTNPLYPVTDFIENFSSAFDRLELFSENGGLSIKILDPKESLKILSEAGGLVLMSGTMPSKDRIEKVWGLDNLEDIRLLRDFGEDYFSVFPKDNRMTRIDPSATSRFTERSAGTWESYARIVEKASQEVRLYGKMTLVCCPSYYFAQNIFANLSDEAKERAIIETTRTRLEDVSDVIEKSELQTKDIILGVARGKILEGVEFVKDECSLIGAVVIAGIPYPIPNDVHAWRSKIVLKRLNLGSSNNRLEFAYFMREPALIVVKQAIGRAIRFPSDRALIHLVDSRFNDEFWRKELNVKDCRSEERAI